MLGHVLHTNSHFCFQQTVFFFNSVNVHNKLQLHCETVFSTTLLQCCYHNSNICRLESSSSSGRWYVLLQLQRNSVMVHIRHYKAEE